MKTQPIYTFAKWQVKEDALETVLQLLPLLVTKSTAEEGNLCYEVHQSLADQHTFLLFEGYKDAAALDAHRESAHFKELVLEQIVPLLANREVHLTRELISM